MKKLIPALFSFMLLTSCASDGGVLVVGIGSDDLVKAVKEIVSVLPETAKTVGTIVNDTSIPLPISENNTSNVEDSAPQEIEVVPGVEEKTYDHYNPAAWNGNGSAIILCLGAEKFDSCNLNGIEFVEHSAKDKGRYVYTAYTEPGLGGIMKCIRGNEAVNFKLEGSGLQYGDCN